MYEQPESLQAHLEENKWYFSHNWTDFPVAETSDWLKSSLLFSFQALFQSSLFMGETAESGINEDVLVV